MVAARAVQAPRSRCARGMARSRRGARCGSCTSGAAGGGSRACRHTCRARRQSAAPRTSRHRRGRRRRRAACVAGGRARDARMCSRDGGHARRGAAEGVSSDATQAKLACFFFARNLASLRPEAFLPKTPPGYRVLVFDSKVIRARSYSQHFFCEISADLEQIFLRDFTRFGADFFARFQQIWSRFFCEISADIEHIIFGIFS